MNDHDLDLTLGAIGEQRSRVTTPPTLRSRVRAVPLEAPASGQGWLGRFRSMFSATKLVFAGIVVALVGAFLVSGILPSSDQVVAPGAEATPTASVEPAPETTSADIAPVAVSARYGVLDGPEPDPPWEEFPVAGDGVRSLNSWWHTGFEFSDDRLDGRLLTLESMDVYPRTRYVITTMRLETADGAWQMEPIVRVIDRDERSELGDTIWVGEGAYDGLAIVATLDGWGHGFDLDGYIVDAGVLPDAPEPGAAE